MGVGGGGDYEMVGDAVFTDLHVYLVGDSRRWEGVGFDISVMQLYILERAVITTNKRPCGSYCTPNRGFECASPMKKMWKINSLENHDNDMFHVPYIYTAFGR